MERKKTEKADLESKKGLFFQIGLVTVLILLYVAFEWTTQDVRVGPIGELEQEIIEEELVPITRREEPPPPPPPAPEPSEEFEIVEDDVEIEDEFIIEDAETRAIRDDFRIRVDEGIEEEEEEEDQIFHLVEDMPTFQGEEYQTFTRWIADNLRYPQTAVEAGIQGTVILQFVVEQDGNVSNVEVIRGVDRSLDQEAVRVIEASPTWEPGRQRDEPVRVSFTFPINFVLED